MIQENFIDIMIFGIGILITNAIFFKKTENYTVSQTVDYLKNFNAICVSYLVILGVKLISTFTTIFLVGNKISCGLSCLLLSPITFSLFFVFVLIIEFLVYLLLSSNSIKLNTNMQNIIFVIISLVGTFSLYFLNTHLSKLDEKTMSIIFKNALPLQK
jgi:hypothetical protein